MAGGTLDLAGKQRHIGPTGGSWWQIEAIVTCGGGKADANRVVIPEVGPHVGLGGEMDTAAILSEPSP